MTHAPFRPSIEHLPIIAYALHVNDGNRMRYVSPRVFHILGYTPCECTGESSFFLSRTHPDDQEAVKAATQHAFATGEPFGFEYRVRASDGRYVWLRDDAVVIPDDSGQPLLWQGVLFDITDRKQAEAALRLALAAAQMGTWDWDLTTGVLSWSAATEAIHGRAPGTFSRRYEDFLSDVHPEDRPHVESAVASARASGDDYESEYRVIRQPPDVIWEFAKGRVVRDAMGRAVRMTGVSVNITARRQAEEQLRRSEERFRSLVQHTGDIIAIADVDGTIRYISPSVEGVLGVRAEDIVGKQSFAFHHPDDSPQAKSAMMSIMANPGADVSVEMRARHAEGSWRWLEMTITNHLVQPGIEGLVINARDVTERKQTDQKVRETEARYRALVEQTAAVMYIEDVDLQSRHRRLRYISPQIQTMLGYSSEEWIANPMLWHNSLHADDRSRVATEITHAQTFGTPLRIEYRLFARDGRVVWVRDEALPAISTAGQPQSWQGIIHDITDRKVMEAQLAHQAFHDVLTGLPNRALFGDRLGHALQGAIRHNKPIAILFLDLDRFKLINDSLGHEAGDRLLVEAGERVTQCLRAGDTVARLGGDEFAVLLANASSEEAQQVADRILAQLLAPFHLAGQEVFVSASIGISLSSPHAATPDELLRSADLALYQAKQAGRATAITFQPGMSIWPSSRVGMERDLRRAIELGELKLVYQPIFDLVSMQVVALEALLRWHHPTRGVISPAEFLPIAEETGLIEHIGSWTLEEACHQFGQWQAIDPRLTPPTINVNVSRRQLRDPGFLNRVIRALSVSAHDPAALRLEIAEETLIDDLREISGVFRELRELGIRLAIDDFGAGATSLASLRELPVEELKLDQSFIRPLGIDPGEDEDIVAAVTALAHRLGMVVTAEGIETPAQLDAVRRAGCDRIQGYLVGRPVPAEEVLDLLRRGAPLASPVALWHAEMSFNQLSDPVSVIR